MHPSFLTTGWLLDFTSAQALHGKRLARSATAPMGDALSRIGSAVPATPQGSVLERARQGDPAAFRELYAVHKKQVVSQLSYLVPRDELEDALQDVFIEVFRSLRRFEGRSAFTTWLYRVVMHVAMKARRKAGRSRVEVHLVDPPDAPDLSPGPAESMLSFERRARVELLLDRLSPKKRTVLVLHDMRGMAAARIAEITASNILTVRTRLFYARREFEKLAAADPALAELFRGDDAKESA